MTDFLKRWYRGEVRVYQLDAAIGITKYHHWSAKTFIMLINFVFRKWEFLIPFTWGIYEHFSKSC